jgi:hypothetical protein
MSHLPTGVRINECISLLSLITGSPLSPAADSSSPIQSDVGDVRDFLVGSKQGGLVVRLPTGDVARVPYMAPYVRLSSRMSIPLEAELELSRMLWLANAQFFESLPLSLRVADAWPDFRRLAAYLGWAMGSPLEDFCQWHAEALRRGTTQATPKHLTPRGSAKGLLENNDRLAQKTSAVAHA